jgi:hypothetical protein
MQEAVAMMDGPLSSARNSVDVFMEETIAGSKEFMVTSAGLPGFTSKQWMRNER